MDEWKQEHHQSMKGNQKCLRGNRMDEQTSHSYRMFSIDMQSIIVYQQHPSEDTEG